MTWMSPSTAPMMPMVGAKATSRLVDAGQFFLRLRRSESSSSCMMARNSLDSVPSTASMRARRMKGSGDGGEFGVERDDAIGVAPSVRGLGEAGRCFGRRARVSGARKSQYARWWTAGDDGGEGKLQEYGANRPSGDDECGGWLKNLAKLSTFEQQAGGIPPKLNAIPAMVPLSTMSLYSWAEGSTLGSPRLVLARGASGWRRLRR